MEGVEGGCVEGGCVEGGYGGENVEGVGGVEKGKVV